MALCDRLDAVQAERESRRGRVSFASLRQIATAGRPTAIAAAVRSYVGSLQVPATNPMQISDLRSSILYAGATGALGQGLDAVTVDPSATTQDRSAARWLVLRLDDVAEHIVDCPHSTPKWTESAKICVRTN